MSRLQLYNLVSGAAVPGYWPSKGAAVVPPVKSYEARPLWPGQSSVHYQDGCSSTHHQGCNRLYVTNDEINMLKTPDHIQIACRQVEDSRSTRCLLFTTNQMRNELIPSSFIRFSFFLISSKAFCSRTCQLSIISKCSLFCTWLTLSVDIWWTININDQEWMTSSSVVCFVSPFQSKHKSWRYISISSPLRWSPQAELCHN